MTCSSIPRNWRISWSTTSLVLSFLKMPQDEESGIYQNTTGPISLAFEGKRISNGYQGELFNDYGFVVRAKAVTGEDIHLWSFIYQQQGPETVSCCPVLMWLRDINNAQVLSLSSQRTRQSQINIFSHSRCITDKWWATGY